jgi:hypothetical protein
VSQRSHAYAYEVGLLIHEPSEVVSVWPATGFPLIVGSAVATGGSVRPAVGAGELGAEGAAGTEDVVPLDGPVVPAGTFMPNTLLGAPDEPRT